MKKSTKYIIAKTLFEKLREYERSINYCLSGTVYHDEHPHVKRLKKRVDEIRKALDELKAV